MTQHPHASRMDRFAHPVGGAFGAPGYGAALGTAPPPASLGTSAPSVAADEAVRFSVLIVLVAMLLQRFVLPVGDLQLSVVGPIGLLCCGFWLLRGVLVLDRRRVMAFFAIAAVGCLGSLLSMTASTARFAAVSWTSLAQFLLLNLFALLAFRVPVDEERFFAAINACLAFVGVAGILQFFAQFVGINLFSFTELGVPAQYTLEHGYNILNTAGPGGVLKANGFFLAEASIYSQMMAMGLAAELVYSRRTRYLATFALGLVLSISGTGWLVLGAFVAAAVAHQGGRGLALAIGALIVGMLALSVLAFALPDLFEYFVGRIDEFSSPGSSAHVRFITPFWVLSDIAAEAPWSLLVGAGAGASERLQTQVSYFYTLNTPFKVLLEYGLLGLGAYLVLFLAGDRTKRHAALLPPAMALFLFTGGYAQFAPVLFPILLVTSVARLQAPASSVANPGEWHDA